MHFLLGTNTLQEYTSEYNETLFIFAYFYSVNLNVKITQILFVKMLLTEGRKL